MADTDIRCHRACVYSSCSVRLCVIIGVMPGFQHYVSGVPDPFCRCRFAVAVLPLPEFRFRCRFVQKQRNWMETIFR